MHYLSTYINLAKRILLLLFIYFLCRLAYLVFNFGLLADVPIKEIMGAFFYGILFDLSVILYINLPFIFLSLPPFHFIFKPLYQKILRIYFLITNMVPITFNLSDIEYSKFIGKRSDASLFDMGKDINEQFLQMALDYWHLVVTGIALGILLWKLFPLIIPRKYKIKAIWIAPVFILFLGFVVWGGRGSLSVKPLLPIAAYKNSPKTGNLVLNTPFCILHSLGKEPLERKSYFTEEELLTCLPKQIVGVDSLKVKDNIIIFILESFSPEFIGHLCNNEGYTPFLDSLAKEGHSFRYGFANGRKSQKAISTILTGIPQLMNKTFVSSVYQTNTYFSLVEYLKKYGYKAYFFHGGNNGTLGLDFFTKKMGYQYFGANEYPHKEDHDGSWGICDEPYLKYCSQMLDSLPGPFISVIFTLSSHQPYVVPEHMRQIFNKGKYPPQNAIAYADYSLRGFFEHASNQEWYQNTLFIFTADHVHPPVENESNLYLNGFRVPLILFHSEKHFDVDTVRIVQHSDIIPSIADYLGVYPGNIPRFGKSFFTKSFRSEAFFMDKYAYCLVRKNYYINMLSGEFQCLDWLDNRIPLPDSARHDTTMMKAYIQYFNNSMLSNSFAQY